MYTPLKFLKKWRGRAEESTSGSGIARGLSEDQARAVYAVTSWLIDYPDAGLIERLPQIRALIAQTGLPPTIAEPLTRTVGHLGEGDVYDLRSEYVETFDTRRKGCLFLTYFTNGDTRKRGRALLEIKEIYREAGLVMDESQLPDHLTYVLEFAAGHDLDAGVSILLKNRAGLELLRLHLVESDSMWAGAAQAICATLPPLDGDDIHAIQRLAADGPAEETVGLDGLGGYGDDPFSEAPPMAGGFGAGGHGFGEPGAGAASNGCGAGADGSPAFIPLSDVTGVQS